MKMRVFLTLATILAYCAFAALYWPQAALTGAAAGGAQLNGGDPGFLQSTYTNAVIGALSRFALLIAFGAIALIWFGPARRALQRGAKALDLALLFALAAVLVPDHAHAFASKTDATEIIPIPPNWSAFWIPGFGDAKTNQVQMNTEAFLQQNKVAVKYFQVTHVKLSGSAGYSMFSGYDYYVNSGVLILVDRTRYSREWVDAADRGTSTGKQGFPCQSKEGINITTGVSVGAYVTEQDSAKFLYNFGVQSAAPYQATGNPDTDLPNVFKSVQYGRSLTNVMDDVGRKMVQTLVCNQIGMRTFDQANADVVPMMAQVQKDAAAYFSGVGITLDFIGWADTFSFDAPVQDAINRKYVAMQDEDIAKRLQPYSVIIQALASAQATRDFGAKTDGKLPQTYVGVTPEIAAILQQLQRSTLAPPLAK